MSNSGPDPERLRELGAKLDEVQKQKVRGRPQASHTASGIVMRLSTELVVAPLFGAAVGYGLDWLFGTRPILTICVFLLGAVAGVRNVMIAAKELNAQANPGASKDGE